MTNAGRLAATTLSKAFLAFCVAFSGAVPTYAAVPAPRPVLDEAALEKLIVRIQSVDPGDPDPDPDPDPDRGGNSNDRSGRADWFTPGSRYQTTRVIEDLTSVRWECSQYDAVYRIDCLRQGIEQTIAKMPDVLENRDARRILETASRKLATIVSTYEDENAALLEVSPRVNPRFKKRRTYRAVKKADLPNAMAEANAVVTEAATELLRSAENSERRYAHYQQISAAVDSTKTLLRSG